MHQHLPGLRAFVRLRGGPTFRARESCSDLVQSALREVLQKLDSGVDLDTSAFRSWLFTVASRKIMNRHRFQQAACRDARREDGETPVSEREVAYASLLTPSRVSMAREEVSRLEGALLRMSDSDRDLLISAHLIGRTRAEMAADLDVEEGVVRTRLCRARARLAREVHRTG